MSTTLQRPRILGLDLLRFGAAAIVFLGHLVFNVKKDGNSSSFWDFVLSPIHTGAYAVLFFFSLSGFVLANQDFKKIKIKFWLLSRWIRLMPVFYLTYLVGLLLLIAGAGFKPNLIHSTVELTGLSGMTQLGVPAANPPLWSLSVELILSILFPFISKVKKSSFSLSFYLAVYYCNKLSWVVIQLFMPFHILYQELFASDFSRSKNKIGTILCFYF